MSKHTLSADIRKLTGRKVKSIRRQGLTPANIFGKNIKSQSLQISTPEFLKLRKETGESTLIYLDITGEKEPRPVMVHEVTVDPVTDHVLHVDFHQVDLKEKTTAPVAVKLTGESPAEKEKLGILVQQLHEVEVEALPADMPESIELTVEKLVAVGDAIYVKDISVSSKLVIKTDPESIVVKIEALAKEEPKEEPVVPAVEGLPAEAEARMEGEVPTEAKTEESTDQEAPAPAK